MTDEERMVAERLAKEFCPTLTIRGEASPAIQGGFIAGYAAACEAKRAEIERHLDTAAEMVIEKVKAERARSAKLLAALQDISLRDRNDETCNGLISDRYIARAAIAEYETSK